MGNCVFGGFAGVDQVIKVATSNGGLMEFDPPITVEFITNKFPGYGKFRSDDIFGRRQPLLHNEELLVGKLYYLLPLLPREDGLGMNTISMVAAPYHMSFENHGVWKRFEIEGGIWKVKLAISAEKLAEILSQEAPTEALIESVRTVAKCRNGSSSAVSSDQRSLSSSSRKARVLGITWLREKRRRRRISYGPSGLHFSIIHGPRVDGTCFLLIRRFLGGTHHGWAMFGLPFPENDPNRWL